MKTLRTAFLVSLALSLSCAAYAKTADKSPTAKAADKTPGQKHDKHAPIDVTSDSLEVLQKENKAIFTGHVVAIQAEMRLKSDVMIVYYRTKGNPDDPAAKKEKPKDKTTPATPDDSSIEKIETSGNVFLSTPQETASGDTGLYEPDDHLLHLNDHVVLTRGKNVLKGDHLVYNLDTGKSNLTADAPAKDAKTPTRVHALFVPGDDKTKKDKNDKAAKDPKVTPP